MFSKGKPGQRVFPAFKQLVTLVIYMYPERVCLPITENFAADFLSEVYSAKEAQFFEFSVPVASAAMYP